MKCYSVMRKEAILPLPTTWIDLEHVMLSEVSQRQETQVLHDNLHVESKEIKLIRKSEMVVSKGWGGG